VVGYVTLHVALTDCTHAASSAPKNASLCLADHADVRHFCMSWLLDPFCFLHTFPHSVSVAVCSILACYVILVEAPVAHAAMHAGERAFVTGLVHSCLRPLSLPPSTRVERRRPSSYRPFGGAEAEALWVRRCPRFAFLFFNAVPSNPE
jgi:hypothetical protein